MNEYFKKHTYSQLFLISTATQELYKTESKADDVDFDALTGDEYMEHLRKSGLP